MKKKYITFDFDKVKNWSKVYRIYKSEIFRYINRHKDCVWTIIDQYGDSSHHTFRQVEDYFIKNSIKLGYINKEDKLLYIETLTSRLQEQRRYIVTPQKVTGI